MRWRRGGGKCRNDCCWARTQCRSLARSRVPKWLEWYSAWSLLITLVWMWTEAIRLLSLLAGGRDE